MISNIIFDTSSIIISGSDYVTLHSSKFYGKSSGVQIARSKVNYVNISHNTFFDANEAIVISSANTVVVSHNSIGMF